MKITTVVWAFNIGTRKQRHAELCEVEASPFCTTKDIISEH